MPKPDGSSSPPMKTRLMDGLVATSKPDAKVVSDDRQARMVKVAGNFEGRLAAVQ